MSHQWRCLCSLYKCSELGFLDNNLVLGLQSGILKNLLLLFPLHRIDFYSLASLLCLPTLVIGFLLPFAVSEPLAGIGRVWNGEATLGRCLMHHILFELTENIHVRQGANRTYLCKIRIRFIRLQSELQGVKALAAAGERFLEKLVLTFIMVL